MARAMADAARTASKGRLIAFAFGVAFLIAADVLRVYLIMPFPGSQRMDSLELAYALHRFIWPLRVVGALAILPALIGEFPGGGALRRVALVVPLLIYGAIFYLTNFVAMADKMFKQPRHTVLAAAEKNTVELDRLVLGIELAGEARAYPVEEIGYHHQVEDEVAGAPVLATYCTVCRTGRVYRPMVNGQREHFRLVGMDHFNAMFEDATTQSWWRQVSGEAVAGTSKGLRLEEIPSEQMTLRAWLERHPRSLILQPDPDFDADYKALRGFDDGTRGGTLTGRAPGSWEEKSWVVGVAAADQARAYDWNDLQRLKTINDRLGAQPIALWTAPDGKSFAVRERLVSGRELTFTRDASSSALVDAETQSTWSDDGLATAGPLSGERLPVLQGHQEFWHSWRTFHPGSDRYRP